MYSEEKSMTISVSILVVPLLFVLGVSKVVIKSGVCTPNISLKFISTFNKQSRLYDAPSHISHNKYIYETKSTKMYPGEMKPDCKMK